MYIEKINGPADVKKLTLEELPVLAEEIRQALLMGQVNWRTFWTEFWYGRSNHLQCIMYLNHQKTRSCTMYHNCELST